MRRSAASRQPSEAQNATLQALVGALPATAEPADEAVPFLSRRRWSGQRIGGMRYVLGAPELFPLGELAARLPRSRKRAARVVGLRHHDRAVPGRPRHRPAAARALGLAVLAEELRPRHAETIAYLVEQGVEIVVLSGDAAATAGSIAADAGIPTRGPPLEGEAPAGGRRRARPASPRRSPSSAGSRRRASGASSSRCGRRRPLRGDGRRRRQRRAGPEGVAPLDRAGLRHADGEGRRPTSCSSTATSRPSRRWSPRAAGSSGTSSA